MFFFKPNKVEIGRGGFEGVCVCLLDIMEGSEGGSSWAFSRQNIGCKIRPEKLQGSAMAYKELAVTVLSIMESKMWLSVFGFSKGVEYGPLRCWDMTALG